MSESKSAANQKQGALEQRLDMFSPEERSWIMSRVRGKGTSLERKLEHALADAGLEYEKNASDLPGKPDFVFRSAKIAVFVDGCFWHGCPEHCRMPKTRADYWPRKIAKNRERAQAQAQMLAEIGWKCLRLWEHQVKKSLNECLETILQMLNSQP